MPIRRFRDTRRHFEKRIRYIITLILRYSNNGNYRNRFPGKERETLLNRGISLFREIPLERTCEDVSIAPHFCVCQEEEELDINEQVVKNAATKVVDVIQKVM